MKSRSMSEVFLAKLFLIFQGEVQILAEKLHAYLENISFISKVQCKTESNFFKKQMFKQSNIEHH